MMTQEETRAFYNSSAWRKCRFRVLIRDHYLCQDCLDAGRLQPADTVHHKIHLKDEPAKALDEDNLISLCNSCHNKIHPEKLNNKTIEAKEIRKDINFVKIKSNPERW